MSDTRDAETDRSGPAVAEALGLRGYDQIERRICGDEVALIQQEILRLCERCAVVITTGGTGFTARDVTPEATAALLDRRADSLSELIRLRGLEHTPLSHLSRGVAGMRGTVLIVNLPGSPKGAVQGVEALAPLLGAILSALRGEGCPHAC